MAATETVKPSAAHLSTAVKDVGVFVHELQPQVTIRQGFKKSSVAKNCLAVSDSHIFAAQAGKAVVHIYSRAKGNQEATVPFPQKISSLVYAQRSAILVLGTQDGKLILWEVTTGRVTSSSASHIDAITSLVVTPDGDNILSASTDSSIHVWSLKRLVSITAPSTGFDNAYSKNDPVSTFSQHRTGVEVLASGHSTHADTNFVVSASEDKVCYIWNLANQQVLRTILLTQIPQCIALDPADRAIYVGTKDGGVQCVDVFQHESSKSSIFNNDSSTAATPYQLTTKDAFSMTTGAENGPSQCIAISYDGTRLLTGHYSGKVLQWDVPKKRQVGEVSALSGQSVTNLDILRPEGLLNCEASYRIHTVIKPRLELSASEASHTGSSAVPADYSMHVQVKTQPLQNSLDDIDAALMSSTFPQSMLDDAVQALMRNKVGPTQLNSTKAQGTDVLKIDSMQQELKQLHAQIERYQSQDKERLERHQARAKKRQELGQQRRQAFFTAKAAGKNGDDAMKPYMQLEDEIDAESDDEVVNAHNDVEMEG